MKNPGYFKNKKVLIVGLARSGLACANLLSDLGAKVSVTDNQDNGSTRANTQKLNSDKIKVELGKHSEGLIRESELLIISPGVPENAFPVVFADSLGMPAISEIELGWMLCPATVIAVTGSGGKTTVTTLIGRIIEASGKKAHICGNIGTPFSGEVAKMAPEDFVSLEVSSFQLQRIKDFKPRIAVMLNFSRNHLDRHADMKEYLEAKKRIFRNQDKDDYLVLNREDPVLKELAGEAKSKAVFFSPDKDFNPNQAAAAAVASILGIPRQTSKKVFSGFNGLEHRMEQVTEINGIKFINDSKATLAESCAWAIRNIPSPIILIAGGKDKGVDYRMILEDARQKVREVIIIGEAKEKIRQALGKEMVLKDALTLQDAVRMAFKDARPGECVLLSPMCSSFDMFSSYEERGRVFKEAVFELSKEEEKARI